MVKCEECRKKLGVFQGYSHPVLGTRFLVCRNCYDKIEDTMKKWRVFCLSDSFNEGSLKIEIEEAWRKSISNDTQLQKWFSNLWIKIGSQTP